MWKKKSWANGTMLKIHAISTNSNPQHLYLHLLPDSRMKIRCSSAQRIKIWSIRFLGWLLKLLLRSISMFNPIFQTGLEQTRDLGTCFQRRRRIYTKRHGPGLVMYTKKEAIISSSCTRRNKSQCISNLESYSCSCHSS